MQKSELRQKLMEMKSAISGVLPANSALLLELEAFKRTIDDFKATILFIGEFSAGKTALINGFLDRDLLKEAVHAETDIATELVYDTEERIEAYDHEGKIKEYALKDVDKLNSSDYKKYRYHIANDKLKQLERLILVDMPGFNSGVKAHNQALLQYIDKASAYIFVVDASMGTISQAGRSFLREVVEYSENIFFILTKTDKLLPEEIEKVKENIKAEVEEVIQKTEYIEITYSRDEQLSEKLFNIFRNLDEKKLVDESFNQPLLKELEKVITVLRNSSRFLYADTLDLKREMHRRKEEKEHFLRVWDEKEESLNANFSGTIKERIVSDCRITLNNNIEMLASGIRSGKETFCRVVNDLLRPVLISSTNKNVGMALEEFISSLPVDSMVPEEMDSQAVTESFIKTISSLQRINEKIKSSESGKKTYKAIMTTIAILTETIAPWLEIILIFLPDILEKIFESWAESKLKENIRAKVIPAICSCLEQEVEKSLQEIKSKALQQIKDEYVQRIKQEEEVLESLGKSINEKETSVIVQKDNIEKAILKLVAIGESM